MVGLYANSIDLSLDTTYNFMRNRVKKGKHMDNLDKRIITLLQEDGTATNAGIARQVGVSEETVRRRLKRLVADEYIRVVALPDPKKLGFIFIGTINVPAFVVLGLWIVEQLFALPAAMQAQGGIAIVAHLGGFAAGLALTPFLKRRGVTLFQSPHSAAFAHSRTRIIRRRGGSVPDVRRKRD